MKRKLTREDLKPGAKIGTDCDTKTRTIVLVHNDSVVYELENGKVYSWNGIEYFLENFYLITEYTPFVPEIEQEYWTVYGDGIIDNAINAGDDWDNFRIATGNCHRTEEDARKYREYLESPQHAAGFKAYMEGN